jgi:hypothetical protein
LSIADSNISSLVWISSAGISSLPGDLYFFNVVIAISTSRPLGSDSYGSAVCTYTYLTSLTLCTFNYRKMVLPPIQNIVGIHKQITILIFH